MKGLMKIFNNIYFLYFIVFLAITNVLGYLVTNKYNAIMFFVLVCLLTYQFSKNMAVVLLVGLLSTNLLMINGNMKEGMENEENNDDDKLQDIDPELKNGLDVLKSSGSVDEAKEKLEKKKEKHSSQTSEEPIGVGSSLRSNNDIVKESRLDYSATLEEAYDNLDKMLDSDGINKLTKDTQKLMSQQQKLFDTMQNMTPMLEQAKGMLQGFDLKNLSGLAGLASSFNGDTFSTQKGSTKKDSGTKKT
jgi:hypothetical protein